MLWRQWLVGDGSFLPPLEPMAPKRYSGLRWQDDHGKETRRDDDD